jgi:outer membrane protein assembly factor BamB
VIAGDLVIISGLDKGITAYRPVKRGAAWSADQVWQKMDVALYMSSPVVSGGRLYGFSHKNKGQYFCLDLATGKVLWMSDGRQGDNASILLAKGMILSLNSEGDLTEFPASDKMPGEFRKVRVADSPTWAHPVFLGKEVLVKDKTTLALWAF